jgi:hypothetical protein
MPCDRVDIIVLNWICHFLTALCSMHQTSMLPEINFQRRALKPPNSQIYCHVFRGVRDYRRGLDWWMYLLTTYIYYSELHYIVHCYTHTQCSQSVTDSDSRCLVTNRRWFFSFRGRAVARRLTFHTWTHNWTLPVDCFNWTADWTHSTIFSAPCGAQLSTKCSTGTPELDCWFSTELFFIPTLHGQNRKHRF